MAIIDLLPELAALVAASDSDASFRARFLEWIEGQRKGPLAQLLEDMTNLWSVSMRAPGLDDARELVARLLERRAAARAQDVLGRHAEVTGHATACDVVLFAGMRRPEGYSRFDRGRNTVFIGLDHPESLRLDDHFEIVLSHELCHAVRDSAPEVLRDYGGEPSMSHDDFVERHPFREHLVSEGLAGAFSELAYPGRDVPRYVYMNESEYAWCESHRGAIAERMCRALRAGEPYRSFYATDAVAPGSPSGCDYYFGYHLARFALGREPARDLLVGASTRVLERHLDDFLARFDGGSRASVAVPRSCTELAPELAILPEPVQAFYSDWLESLERDPGAARDSEAALARAVARERLDHGGVPYETLAFPIVLAREEERYLAWVVEGMMRVAEKVVALYRADEGVRAFFGLPRRIEELVAQEPDGRTAIPIARFDAHWNGRRVRFLELNTNGTAAIALADRLGPLWLETRAGELASRGRRLASEPVMRRLVEELEAVWERSGRAPHGSAPCVAVVDWQPVATRSEQELVVEALRAAGHEALRVDPSELAFERGALRAGGRAIDLVYRRLTLEDFLEPDPRLEAYLRAVRERRVVSAGSFAADVAHTKRLFAFLTHERWRHEFTMEERALVDAHVPWTRLVEPGPTLRGGELRELREIALEQREQLVLKPAEGHEGRDVLLGIECSSAEWEREFDRRTGRGHVLQEYVPAPMRTVFEPGEGALVPHARCFHLGLFAFGGRAAGALARSSPERVLSRDSAERALPFLVLEA